MNQPVITMIIPVYNAEEFLEQCVLSVLAQTVREIAVILVDDGSTDGSGILCDRFAGEDPRVRVFHTENRGHYTARNIGLEEARKNGSRYIGFVDADDWVDPEMFGVMLDKARETGADVTECGFRFEYPDGSEEWLPEAGAFSTDEALYRLFRGDSHDYFWNKLWKVSCFDGFAFPPVRAYSDMVITYRLLAKSAVAAGIGKAFYHYRQVAGSIVHQHDMRLVFKWKGQLDKYEYIRDEMRDRLYPEQYAEIENDQLLKCVMAVSKNWTWWNANPKAEREEHRDELKQMSRFIRENVPPAGRKGWGLKTRAFIVLMRLPERLSLSLARQGNRLLLLFRKYSRPAAGGSQGVL